MITLKSYRFTNNLDEKIPSLIFHFIIGHELAIVFEFPYRIIIAFSPIETIWNKIGVFWRQPPNRTGLDFAPKGMRDETPISFLFGSS